MSPEDQAELKRRRRARNVVVALVLLGFVVLFYLITMVQIGRHG